MSKDAKNITTNMTTAFVVDIVWSFSVFNSVIVVVSSTVDTEIKLLNFHNLITNGIVFVCVSDE